MSLQITDLFNLPEVEVAHKIRSPSGAACYNLKVGREFLEKYFPKGCAQLFNVIMVNKGTIEITADLMHGRTVKIQLPKCTINERQGTLEAAISTAFQRIFTLKSEGQVPSFSESSYGETKQSCVLDQILSWHRGKVDIGADGGKNYFRLRYEDDGEKKMNLAFTRFDDSSEKHPSGEDKHRKRRKISPQV